MSTLLVETSRQTQRTFTGRRGSEGRVRAGRDGGAWTRIEQCWERLSQTGRVQSHLLTEVYSTLGPHSSVLSPMNPQ